MNTNLTLLWTSLLLYINNFKVFGKSCKKLSNKFDAGERSFVTQLFTKWISLARKCKRMRYAKIIFFSILISLIKKRIWQVCRCNLYDQRKMWKQVFVFFQSAKYICSHSETYLKLKLTMRQIEVIWPTKDVISKCPTHSRWTCTSLLGSYFAFFVTYLIMAL